MGRPPGKPNEGYKEERLRLASLVAARLMSPGGARASFQSLAEACGVSRATLRHYFQDRQGAVKAAFQFLRGQGEEHIDNVANASLGGVKESLSTLLRLFLMGWQRYGVGDIQRTGLELGLSSRKLGPSYVDELLEPVLQGFEQRLLLHIERGELRKDMDPRVGSLMLLSPIVMALLHQDELGGRQCRPLDIEAFLSVHLEAFLRAWQPQAPPAAAA